MQGFPPGHFPLPDIEITPGWHGRNAVPSGDDSSLRVPDRQAVVRFGSDKPPRWFSTTSVVFWVVDVTDIKSLKVGISLALARARFP